MNMMRKAWRSMVRAHSEQESQSIKFDHRWVSICIIGTIDLLKSAKYKSCIILNGWILVCLYSVFRLISSVSDNILSLLWKSRVKGMFLNVDSCSELTASIKVLVSYLCRLSEIISIVSHSKCELFEFCP